MDWETDSFERLVDHRLVTDWFGAWPSFHDGEVHRIVLARLDRAGAGSSLEIDLRGWVMTTSVSGEYTVSKEALVCFRFDGINDLYLEGFNGQNVITELNISYDTKPGVAEPLRVVFEHCYLFECHFNAKMGKVTRVLPWQPT